VQIVWLPPVEVGHVQVVADEVLAAAGRSGCGGHTHGQAGHEQGPGESSHSMGLAVGEPIEGSPGQIPALLDQSQGRARTISTQESVAEVPIRTAHGSGEEVAESGRQHSIWRSSQYVDVGEAGNG